MVNEAHFAAMKGRLPEVRQLFQTRHYIQCASLCERLMTWPRSQVHPVHQAYLNFYLALSHDTQARESGIRNRTVELDLAERHYISAVTVLTRLEGSRLEDGRESQSPTSSKGDSDFALRRASDNASLNSDGSISTVATSILDEPLEDAPSKPPHKKSVSFSSSAPGVIPSTEHSLQLGVRKRRPSPIRTLSIGSNSSQHDQQFSIDISVFLSMVKAHLAGVRELKNTGPIVTRRFSSTRSRSSTISSRPYSRESMNWEAGMDRIRHDRKNIGFRPRFDPTSVQKLCSDALEEL